MGTMVRNRDIRVSVRVRVGVRALDLSSSATNESYLPFFKVRVEARVSHTSATS